MNKNDDKKNVYQQLAWIVNYQPTITNQHIHMGNQTVKDSPITKDAPANEAPSMGFAAAVIDNAKAEAVIELLRRLMIGKQKPKDVMMPVRAAMEAGVIRRPTWEEFCSEFGIDLLKSKSSFSDYTNPARKPYEGEDFEALKSQFLKL